MPSFSFNSLRSQLLLWISLPVLVVLLTFALTGVQGHGHAMHELVQTRADSLARAAAALVSARVERTQNELLRLSSMLLLHHAEIDGAVRGLSHQTTLASALVAFREESQLEVALFEDAALLIATESATWPGREEVGRLIQSVATQGSAEVTTFQDDSDWWVLHGLPITVIETGSTRVLVGALPLAHLELPALLLSLELDEPSILTLRNAEGMPILTLSPGLADPGELPTTDIVTARAMAVPLGWQVEIEESWGQWIPPVLRFGNMLFLVVLAAATLSILSAYFGLQQIIYPLERLHRAVSQLGQGHFEAVQHPVGGVQEVGELQQALANMAIQIQQYQQELQDYIGAMTMIQEEERKRVARELHDETVQALIALNQQVEMAEQRLSQDPERAAERLRELRPLIGQTINGIRRQIQNLRPLYLEDLGFVPALEMLVQQTATQHGLVGDFEVSGEPQRPLPPAVEISGYRIVQEALQNVANHARATWVHVEVTFDAQEITLRIEDDGVGFDAPSHPHQLAHSGHYGLLGIGERVRLHGGQLSIESRPGQGTSLIARLFLDA
jgi:signal transduction histidine kinase